METWRNCLAEGGCGIAGSLPRCRAELKENRGKETVYSCKETVTLYFYRRQDTTKNRWRVSLRSRIGKKEEEEEEVGEEEVWSCKNEKREKSWE